MTKLGIFVLKNLEQEAFLLRWKNFQLVTSGLTSANGRDTVGQLSDKLYFVRNKHSYHLKKKLAGDSRGHGFYGQMSATRTP